MKVRIPLVFPGLDSDRFTASRDAILPGWDRTQGPHRLPGREVTTTQHRDGVTFYRRTAARRGRPGRDRRLSEPQRRARLERVVGHMVNREGPVLSAAERARLVRRVVDEALGLGVLEPLLADPTVTEIMVNGPDGIYVERDGRLERSTSRSPTRSSSTRPSTASSPGEPARRRVQPDGRRPPPTGERVNVIIPPLSLTGPTLTIRRFPRPFTSTGWSAWAPSTADAVELLHALVQAKLNVVVSGGTGTGKTTLLDALSAAIPERERIVTIEDSAELRLQQPHVVRSRPAPPTSRAGARSPSATSCATPCGCARTASSSARSAAARRWTCCRR